MRKPVESILRGASPATACLPGWGEILGVGRMQVHARGGCLTKLKGVLN